MRNADMDRRAFASPLPVRWRGSSLLDELTAMVVLSIGLLGLAGLQGRVSSAAANAESQTMALTLAQSELERLRGIADGANAPSGYARIADRKETIHSVGEQHSEAPYVLRVDVARFALQDKHYIPVGDDVPMQPDVPEFKRVTVSVAWTSRNGVTHSLALPGILGPSVF